MNKPIKILMLEDNESDAGLIMRVLKKAEVNFDSLLVDTKEEFIKGLEIFKPDAIFSDHSLPHFNSLEAFSIFKSKQLNIPFILVTGTVSEEFAVKCLQEGIDDYILKDHLTRLPTALDRALNKRNLVGEKQQLVLEQTEFIEKIKNQNKELLKINKELDRFVYSTSHELRAPLLSALGLVYLIEMEIAENRFENLENYLHLIKKCIEKMIHIVDEIMNFAINKRTQPENERINIWEIYYGAMEKLKPIDDKIEKKVQFEENNNSWYSDKSRIMLVLENLISNAIKYRDKSKEKPCVFTKVQIFPDKVFLTVEDNGIGIPDENTDKIFNMFFRGTSISEGAGLGLYLVREATETLNGKIEVKSKLGKGTLFKLTFPNRSKEI